MPIGFFFLVFLLSIPFWLFGHDKLPLAVNLPVAALTAFVPMLAAFILNYQRYGFRGIQKLAKRIIDYHKTINILWYILAFSLAPIIHFLSYVMILVLKLPLPETVEFPLHMLPIFFAVYFVGAIGEELGWTGYAIDPMQKKFGFLMGSFLLGCIWAVWHFIPFVQTGNSLSWIFWQNLGAIPLRILIVWIYNKTGKSVFAAIIMHTMVNVSWSLFPNYGSHYNPFFITVITAIIAGIIIFRYGLVSD